MPKYKNETNISLSVAVWLASDRYDYNHDPHTISVTSLMKPAKQLILASRIGEAAAALNLTPEPEDIAGRVASCMGTAFHDSIEYSWVHNYKRAMLDLGYAPGLIKLIRINPTDEDMAMYKAAGKRILPVYMERRSSKKVGKWTVSGKFDFVGEGRLEDFKSTGTYTYTKQTNSKKYVEQGSLYRWLNTDIITQDIMAVQFIFTDWQKNLAFSNPKYPQKRVMDQKFTLMPVSITQNWVENRLQVLDDCWDKPECELPSCSDYDLWRAEPSWKYYKNPDNAKKAKGRSTKNFDNKPDAMKRFVDDGSVGIVVEKGGEVKACNYCQANATCEQRLALIADGSLKG